MGYTVPPRRRAWATPDAGKAQTRAGRGRIHRAAIAVLTGIAYVAAALGLAAGLVLGAFVVCALCMVALPVGLVLAAFTPMLCAVARKTPGGVPGGTP